MSLKALSAIGTLISSFAPWVQGEPGMETEAASRAGEDHVDVVEDKLSVEAIVACAASPTSGAIAVFVGKSSFGKGEELHSMSNSSLPLVWCHRSVCW